MRKRARVYGNDDERPVIVFLDELHPHSRLRSILNYDSSDELTVGCSRDCVRSLVASQRCGRIIVKGDTTSTELEAELDRDCVDIRSTIQAPDCVTKLCESLTRALACWPRMIGGMDAHMKGMKTEWDSGPMHCVVRFVAKPNAKSADQRPIGSLVHALLKWIIDDTGETSLDAIRACIDQKKVKRLLDSDPFWFVAYDDNMRLSKNVSALSEAIQTGRDEGDKWCTETLSSLEEFHDQMIDLMRLFHNRKTPALELLKEGLISHRLRLTIPDYHSNYPPLIFPTAWCVDRVRHTGFTFILERF